MIEKDPCREARQRSTLVRAPRPAARCRIGLVRRSTQPVRLRAWLRGAFNGFLITSRPVSLPFYIKQSAADVNHRNKLRRRPYEYSVWRGERRRWLSSRSSSFCFFSRCPWRAGLRPCFATSLRMISTHYQTQWHLIQGRGKYTVNTRSPCLPWVRVRATLADV